MSLALLLGAAARPAAATPSAAPSSASPANVTSNRTPTAPSTAAAAIDYRRGVALYDAGDHEAALGHFERAYALSRKHQLLFNIGQLHYELQRYARARAALERYLREGHGQISRDRQSAVQRQLAELARRTGVLIVHLDGAPTRLEVQGQSIETGAAELPIIVEPGRVDIVARRPRRGSV